MASEVNIGDNIELVYKVPTPEGGPVQEPIIIHAVVSDISNAQEEDTIDIRISWRDLAICIANGYWIV